MKYYIYNYYQKFNKDGTPVIPEEYMKGDLLGIDDYESMSDCEEDIKWVVTDDKYLCTESLHEGCIYLQGRSGGVVIFNNSSAYYGINITTPEMSRGIVICPDKEVTSLENFLDCGHEQTCTAPRVHTMDLSKFPLEKVENFDRWLGSKSFFAKDNIAGLERLGDGNMIKSAAQMFTNLEYIDLPDFEGAFIENGNDMFTDGFIDTDGNGEGEPVLIERINLPSFTGENMRTAHRMFRGTNIKSGEISLPKFTGENLRGASDMFTCYMPYVPKHEYWVKRINLPSFTGENLIDAENMFQGILTIEEINLPLFTGSNLQNYEHMFAASYGYVKDVDNYMQYPIEYLSLPSFTGNTTSENGRVNNEDITSFACFANLIKVKSIDLPVYNCGTKDIRYMFLNCRSLTELNLPQWDGRFVEERHAFCYNCLNLRKISMPMFTGENIHYPGYDSSEGVVEMFDGCPKLEELDLYSYVGNQNSSYYASEDLRFLKSLTSLKKLYLNSYNNKFNNVKNFNYLDLPSLEILNINAMPVPDSPIDNLWRNSVNLKEIWCSKEVKDYIQTNINPDRTPNLAVGGSCVWHTYE